MASFVSGLVKATLSKVVGAATFPYSIGIRYITFYIDIINYIGDRVPLENSIWALHKGTRKEDGSAVSIFVIDTGKDRQNAVYAQHMFKKSKTIRHPNLVSLVETIELDTVLYIVTEPVEPLSLTIAELRSNTELLTWGLYTIAVPKIFHVVSYRILSDRQPSSS